MNDSNPKRKHAHNYSRTWADLQRIVADRLAESRTLEFKRDPYSHPRKPRPEEDKLELRRDATAMANAGGGTILIGVEEDSTTGCAMAAAGIAGAVAHEGFVRDVLMRFIEPPLGKALRVKSILSPESGADGRGVVVVEVGPCDRGRPFGTQSDRDKPFEFWLRTDRKKLAMTYAEIQAAFGLRDEDQAQQQLDVAAVLKVKEIRHAIRDAHWDFPRMQALLEQVRPYIEDFDFGFPVRQEVVAAADEVLHLPRAGIPARVARDAIQILMNALPSYGELLDPGPYSALKHDLLRHAASLAHHLVYDGFVKMDSLPVVAAGGELFRDLLVLLRHTGLKETALEVRGRLGDVKDRAQEQNARDVIRLLDFYEEDGLADRDHRPPLPVGLEWAVLGKEAPPQVARTRGRRQ